MGNLKNVYLSLILLFSLGILLFVIYYDKKPNYDVYYVDSFTSENVINLYVLDENMEIRSCKVSVNDKNDYEEIFSYYNERMNSLDSTLISPLIFFTDVNSLKLENDILYITVSKLSEEVDNKKLLDCLYKTYSELGIKKIVLNSGKMIYLID